MKVIVEVRDVYGCRNIYPLCATGHLLAALAGTKTLTAQAISIIKKLGYSIEIIQKEVQL